MIIAIVGPTGVGKTKMSVELAKQLNGEIINADSTQVYQEINIGTAKATVTEMAGIPHHLLDITDLESEYTVFDYQNDARQRIENIKNKHKIPIIVGGSGLYLSALLYDYQFGKEDNVYDLDSLSDKEMYATLKRIHPDLEIDKKNRQRLIRAYAKYINNSEPIENQGGQNLYYDDVIIIGLTTNRENLYEIINKRVEQMIENDLIKEVRTLYQKYPNSKQLKATIGYKEIISYIENEISLEEAIIEIKQNSRNYAKRQYTWLNHKMEVKWFDVNYDNFEETIESVMNEIGNKS